MAQWVHGVELVIRMGSSVDSWVHTVLIIRMELVVSSVEPLVDMLLAEFPLESWPDLLVDTVLAEFPLE